MFKLKRKVSTSVDLTEGPLFKRIILYTLPIIATGILQLLFNTADIIVVGRSANKDAIGAIGATGALINLIVNLLLGLSVGAGVLAAQYFGSRDEKSMKELVHTAIPTALIGGILFGAIGFAFADTFLGWMQTPSEHIGMSTLYIRIYCIGIPFSIVYNFGAAVLRSVGDTTRPLIYLVISGVVNVLFNLLFVLGFHMDVDGVAIATVVSQLLSAGLVLFNMMRTRDSYRLELKKLRFYKEKFLKMLAIGIPAGVQGSFFSISNVIIQSGINSFGGIALNGNTAASSIEGFVYVGMNAFHQTALNFTGQHIGAKKYQRIKKITVLCLLCVGGVGLILGLGAFALARPLVGLYIPTKGLSGEELLAAEEAISIAITRMSYICAIYFLCGLMDVLSGILRGMNYSTSSMLITLFCVCGLRIVWIFTIFRVEAYHTLSVLYLSYPISWVICIVFQFALFLFAYLRLMRKAKKEESLSQPLTEQENP